MCDMDDRCPHYGRYTIKLPTSEIHVCAGCIEDAERLADELWEESGNG